VTNNLWNNLTTDLPKSSTSNVKTPTKFHTARDNGTMHYYNALIT